MSQQPLACIVLAAGKGTRMKSATPKVLHKIAGRPMINHVTAQAESLSPQKICVVIAPDMDDVADAVSPHATAIQQQQKGTGDAVKAAKDALEDFKGQILILIGDAPLLTATTLSALRDAAQDTGLAVLGMVTEDPTGYGRLELDDEDFVTAIVEDKDCSAAQKDITLCNAGNFCVDSKLLWQCLDELQNDNAQGEYYLTDIVSLAAAKGVKCGLAVTDEIEALGVNSRNQLAQAEWVMQTRLREAAMAGGVTLLDPETVFLNMDTTFGQDVLIEPNVFIGGNVHIGDHVTIHAYTHLQDTKLGDHVKVGPFARLRGECVLEEGAVIGNFVECKKAHMHEGAKAKHLAYIGDATVGAHSNISAGVITVNYDGYEKHHTTIGSNVMVGCDTTLVAPVTIGDGAYIAAGSAITTDVAPDALAVARNRPIIRDGWAASYRQKKQKSKKKTG